MLCAPFRMPTVILFISATGIGKMHDVLVNAHRCRCGHHIIGNTRSACPAAQRGFHDDMIWRVIKAKDRTEFSIALASLAKNYPAAAKFLTREEMDRKSWVHCKMVKIGVSTFEWATSNMAEQINEVSRVPV